MGEQTALSIGLTWNFAVSLDSWQWNTCSASDFVCVCVCVRACVRACARAQIISCSEMCRWHYCLMAGVCLNWKAILAMNIVQHRQARTVFVGCSMLCRLSMDS